MKIENDIQKTLAFDPDKVEQALSDLIDVFQKHKLRVGEILIAYGNLGYLLGAAAEGYVGKGPGVEELKQSYYTKPTPGVGLMLQGLTISSWYDQYANIKIEEDKDKDKDIQGEKE